MIASKACARVSIPPTAILRETSEGDLLVALEFDTRRAPVRASHYLDLVKAIRAASAADELDWLEWKSTLDFRPRNKADKSARAHLARAIIGFANRQPDVALRNVEGHGFLVVGVDPEGYHGVEELDSVELERWVTAYVGEGIDWRSTYVHVSEEGHERLPVLIVTVSPPNWGDPIFCIRKEIPPPPRGVSDQAKDKDTIREATIFVRRPGRTDRARPVDIDRLGERLLRKNQTLDLALSVQEAAVTPVLVPDEALEELISAERKRLVRPLPRAATDEPGTLDQVVQALASEIATGRKPDPRGRDGYLQEVELYLEALRKALPGTLAEVAALTAPFVMLRLHNHTQTHLKGVQVRLEMPEGVLALVPAERVGMQPFPSGLPKAPRPYGPVTPSQWAFDPSLLQYSAMSQPSVVSPRWNTEVEVEGTTVIFPDEDLRVGLYADLAAFVAVTAQPWSGMLAVPWTATATNMDGIAQGTTSLPIAPERSLFALIAAADATEDENSVLR
ncbi:hypothetical protein ACIBM4_05705 [Streptomyces sp. NPDC050256]|uniref:hypothetical protein n=1 Tax=Streptomyces sp. NPDC050256 TaxID=3365607 RepID=UPI0037ABE471